MHLLIRLLCLEYKMNQISNEFKESKNGKVLLSHIISMLKGVHFIEKAKSIEELQRQASEGFVNTCNYGINLSHPYYLSLTVGWKGKSYELLELIADKFILHFNELSNGDRKTYCKIIKNTVQNSLLDKRIFDISKQNNENETFFSILAIANPVKPVEHLLDLIYVDLINSLADWLTITPLPRIKSKSHSFIFDGVTLLAPDDSIIWEQLAPHFKNALTWHPSEITNNSKWDAPNTTWFVCQANGTSNGTRALTEKRMRTFVSVLFSILYPMPGILLKTFAWNEIYSIQFPSINSSVRETEIGASIGNILPSIPMDIEISEQNLKDISDWYAKRASLNEETQNRVTVASQFLNYAIVANGIEQFIHFFIVLDALFGKRGDVERLIIEGVKSTFPNDPSWEYKISRLFDLRSELVHGGCSTISEWDELDAYRKHTKSNPSDDVITAAMTAFKNI